MPTAAAASDAVTIAGLTKRYGDLVTVDELCLRVGTGEIYALLGLNGAGMTTTIRILRGMVKPSAGTVTVLGRRLDGDTGSQVWADVGYLVESPSAYPELTVRENLRPAARLRHLSGTTAVDEAIDRRRLVPVRRPHGGEAVAGQRATPRSGQCHRGFWLITTAFVIHGVAVAVIFVHVITYVTALGHLPRSPQQPPGCSAMSVTSRIVATGVTHRRFRPRRG
ncbi:ATP-binding cassette domain-containing protein [Catellatospora sp. NPDC049111]|uniref:ATP-binding cassette domain-containing protein n=1 Tax=Catellatospora sp. NPDC049111 TaxID=3155271 RepID=UPI0033FB0D72